MKRKHRTRFIAMSKQQYVISRQTWSGTSWNPDEIVGNEIADVSQGVKAKMIDDVSQKRTQHKVRDAKAFRDFQPCDHQKVAIKHSWTDVNNVEQLTLPNFVDVRTPLGINYDLTCAQAFERTHLPHEFGAVSADRLASAFDYAALPCNIDLDKDPFDTGFSVWFLIADIVQTTASLKRMRKSRARHFRSQSTAKEIANTELGVQFGILPFFDDIRDFITVLGKWRKMYDEMRGTLDQVYTWHSEETRLEDDSQFLQVIGLEKLWRFEGTWPTSLPGGHQAIIKSDGGSISFRRTLKYKFNCPELTGWLARLKQFIDAFGVLDPAALWDVIPWSFIVDWFVPVGDWLHKHRPKLFPANVVVLDYCEVLKVRHDILIDYHIPVVTSVSGPEDAEFLRVIGSELKHTTFVRRRFTPPEFLVKYPELKGDAMSWRRAGIASALTAQRIPEPRVQRAYKWNYRKS
jgi:hypothetical protein